MYFASYYRWLVIRKWMRVQPSERVLDVGCDDGEIVAQVQALPRYALDIAPHCPDAAVRLIGADARSLPLAAEAFDAVSAFDVIEHIEDDVAVLAELVRVLAPQGTLWLSTPSAGFFIFPRFLTPRANRGWGHVRNGYTLAELREKLPPGITLEVMEWNAPVFRFFHVMLRLLDEVSPALTRTLAGWCYAIDKQMPAGLDGHLFVRVCKSPRPA